MANELTIAARLTYDDAEGVSAELEMLATTFSAGSKLVQKGRMTVTTSELAIPLGSITTLGWAAFQNKDATNFIEIRTATGGTKVVKLKAGEVALFRFGSGITAPFVIADTGSCAMDYIICQG